MSVVLSPGLDAGAEHVALSRWWSLALLCSAQFMLVDTWTCATAYRLKLLHHAAHQGVDTEQHRRATT